MTQSRNRYIGYSSTLPADCANSSLEPSVLVYFSLPPFGGLFAVRGFDFARSL